MKTLKIKLALALLLSCSALNAQTVNFVTSGTVEYTKSVNMYAMVGRMLSGFSAQESLDRYKNSNPQFQLMLSKLSFSKDKTLLQPETGKVFGSFSTESIYAQNNIIYTDLTTKKIIAQKDVMGETFLLKDSIRAIKWKITDETREILGYNCRRANAIIMDSIYVVAFFATDIPVSGGPESFSGLPGMILQLAMPHENISWIATKVTSASVPPLIPPVKGKVVDQKQLRATLEPALQSYGPRKQIYMKAMLL